MVESSAILFLLEKKFSTLAVTRHPSDGFILAESAMNAPGVNYPVQLMDGSGHMQMKNDSNMQIAVQEIFGNGLGGQFFRTNER